MAKIQSHLQVFVGSPGDVAEERKILEDVINEFNLTWGDTHNVRLELVKWETHTRPGFGEDAQDVINKQIGDEYDIFLGIMWGRFGSVTNRAESGTKEEFDRAYTRFKSSPGNVQIMFYFKDAGIPPSKMDLAQLNKVKGFKHKITSELGGLCHEFETTEEFRSKSRIHLSKLVQDWLKTDVTSNARKVTTTVPTPSVETINPLANLMALTDDDDDGVIELSERANDAMEAVASAAEKISEATQELGLMFEQRTNEINMLMSDGSTPDKNAVKRVSSKAASDLEVYVKRLSVEILEFHKQHFLAMDTFGKIAMISGSDIEKDPEDIKAALAQIQGYRNTMSDASDSLSELRGSVAGLPRMTTAFNRARRRAMAVMDDLLVQLRTAGNQLQDVEQLLDRMSKPGDQSVQ